MELFKDFIRPELLILIPVLYLIGIGIKKSEIRDKWIPFILGGCGIALASTYIFAITPVLVLTDILSAIFAAVTQGILCAGASVYVDQLIKQSQKGE